MTGLNSVTLLGHLGSDPISRQTPGGHLVTNMRLAINGYQGRTDWVTVVTWDGLAKACADHLRKGSMIGVQGRLQSRSYERDGNTYQVVEVIATHISFLSPRSQIAAADEAESLEAPANLGF